jgi:hypothetical protein
MGRATALFCSFTSELSFVAMNEPRNARHHSLPGPPARGFPPVSPAAAYRSRSTTVPEWPANAVSGIPAAAERSSRPCRHSLDSFQCLLAVFQLADFLLNCSVTAGLSIPRFPPDDSVPSAMDRSFAAPPPPYASDPVLVHRLTPLRFAMTSPPSGCQGDSHLRAVEHARHTKRSPVHDGSGTGL